MKLLLLASPSSTHIVKWANSLAQNNIDITIYGFGDFDINLYNEKVKIISDFNNSSVRSKSDGSFYKLIYLRYLKNLNKILKEFKPDILHSHYISSYGLLGSLTRFNPHITSVWGNDIFIFPKKSILHKKSIKFVLKNSEMIFGTSKAIADETSLYTNKNINIIPFGIDTNIFINNSNEKKEIITIGTVKALEEFYGIDILLKAFKIVYDKIKDKKLQLLIVGGGSKFNEYKELAQNLGIDNVTKFTGYISYYEVYNYHNMLDISVFLSNSEGFGVSVIEASASCKPVVVSNIMALPEVVINNVTGFIVPPKSPEDAAEAIIKLVNDEQLRIKMGEAGRNFVKQKYEWNDNVKLMINYYENILSKRN